MDMYTWIDYNKELWLTLEDFDKWPVGETYEVALFDRNFEEMGGIWSYGTDKPRWKESSDHIFQYLPKDLFSGIRVSVTKLGGYKWIIDFAGEEFEHDVEVNIKSLRDHKCANRQSRSHVTKKQNNPYFDKGNYELCSDKTKDIQWSPLCKSHLRIGRKYNMHADKLPRKIYIGWRGPMIFWPDVESETQKLYFSTKW